MFRAIIYGRGDNMLLITKLLKSSRGSSAIIFALALTVVLGMSAFVLDIGLVMMEKQGLQNAVDAASLAAAQELPDTSAAIGAANAYIQLNGYMPSDINVTFSDLNKKVNIAGTKTVNYIFAKVLGFNNTAILSDASAVTDKIGGPFNYALFSGSTTASLNLNGSNFYIEGSTHTNNKFRMNGSNQTITGSCEAASTITINGSNINVNVRVPNAPHVEMPDFSEMIKAEAEKAGQAYVGNKSFNSSNVNVSSPIYVNGNVTINGSGFTGKGIILATGDITFNGSNLNNTGNNAVCFYSKNGNITVNGSNATLDGIIYAPNGSVTMNGSNQTINGRVIASEVRFNGSNSRIISGADELKSLPLSSVKLVK